MALCVAWDMQANLAEYGLCLVNDDDLHLLREVFAAWLLPGSVPLSYAIAFDNLIRETNASKPITKPRVNCRKAMQHSTEMLTH